MRKNKARDISKYINPDFNICYNQPSVSVDAKTADEDWLNYSIAYKRLFVDFGIYRGSGTNPLTDNEGWLYKAIVIKILWY